MSSLLERIARRRRASASSRLGPRSQPVNGWEPLPTANGAAWEPIDRQRPVVRDEPVSEPEPELEAPAQPEPEAPARPEPEATTEPEREPFVEHDDPPATDWVEDEDVWIEPEPETATATEPEPEPETNLAPAPAPDPQHPPQPPPAAAHPTPREPPRTTTHVGFAERGQMRRRARYLRRLREVQLRDLGGFVLELHRFHRERPELVAAKLHAAAGTDEELRALEIALDGRPSLRELREAGIGGACAECGAVFGSADRFCASCGAALRSERHLHREPHDERPR